jgi:pilus assembly protein CpaB
MRVITIVSLGASAVLGLGALVVAKTVLPSQAAAKQASAGVAAGVPVVIATKDIKYGDKLEPGMLALAKVPASVVPQGAFSTVQQVLSTDHGGAPIALAPIVAHEAILPDKLSGPGARPSVAAEIADGMRAYTIKVTDVSGVGGHALPGDRVDVVLMRDLTPSGPSRTYVSDIILQNIRVLGIDLNADLTSDKPAEPKNATLEVSVEDAQKLAIASTLGSLSLALRRTGEADADPVHSLHTRDFLSGGPAARPVATAHRAGGYRASPRPMITVVSYGGGSRPTAARAPAAPAAAAPVAAEAAAAASGPAKAAGA